MTQESTRNVFVIMLLKIKKIRILKIIKKKNKNYLIIFLKIQWKVCWM
jgi:hypothetical protein